jgi:hypothetical protein
MSEGLDDIAQAEAAKKNGDKVRAFAINQRLVEIIKFRQSRRWYISIALILVQASIVGAMLVCMALGVALDSDAKEILLLIVGALTVSLNSSIKHWMEPSDDDEAFLRSAQTDTWEE